MFTVEIQRVIFIFIRLQKIKSLSFFKLNTEKYYNFHMVE